MSEMKELANLELNELIKKNEINEKKLKLFFLPKMKLIQKMLLLKLELEQEV